MRMLKIGRIFGTQYEASDSFVYRPEWQQWLQRHIQREWRGVRLGIYTRDDPPEMTWQLAALAMLLPWAILPWLL